MLNEVVITFKCGIMGMSYGFVWFFDVINVDLLATKLDNIFIEGIKFLANVPRFQRKSTQQVQGA